MKSDKSSLCTRIFDCVPGSGQPQDASKIRLGRTNRYPHMTAKDRSNVALGLRRRYSIVMIQIIWIFLNVLIFAVGLTASNRTPVMINTAYSKGMELVTAHHLTPGFVVEFIVLASLLVSVRSLVLQYLVYFGHAPIEVRPIENSSDVEVNTRALDVAFRDYLSAPRLYEVTAVPGDPEPDQLIEILKAPTYRGWRGFIAASITYAFPRRAFIVTATLRTRMEEPAYGVSVQVRRLPGFASELDAQWSLNFDRALKRAAFGVAAHVLPQTRRCREMPWSEWQGCTIPASLFRAYQRAKNMVHERRYDEALNLYHRALLQDANNLALRYDIGQLYERLRLYPDALYTYLQLVNQIFPIQRSQISDPLKRSRKPQHWRDLRTDAYIIRYRYVVALSLGGVIARELTFPEWPALRKWLGRKAPRRRMLDDRPWRVSELRDIKRTLGVELRKLFPELHDYEMWLGRSLLATPAGAFASRAVPDHPGSVLALERYFLKCAEKELALLIADFKAEKQVWLQPRRLRRTRSSLTLTAIRQTNWGIQSRLRRLDYYYPHSREAHEVVHSKVLGVPGHKEPSPERSAERIHRQSISDPEARAWRYSLDEMQRELEKSGYKTSSRSWLEHYNAACLFAFALIDDDSEDSAHQQYAEAAVQALERALRCGQDVDFVSAKRYWLQAGDPDLAGLRQYECFRAFEARIYGRPLAAFGDIAKYELYVYLLNGLVRAASRLGTEWFDRLSSYPAEVPASLFEQWWWQEQRAWNLIDRLGKFYRQWQTRSSILSDLRGWIESFGVESVPFRYPNLILAPDEWDSADIKTATHFLASTEEMFNVLGRQSSRVRFRPVQVKRLGKVTSTWVEYARACRRHGLGDVIMTNEVKAMMVTRAGLWTALRQWAENPSEESAAQFAHAVRRINKPSRNSYRQLVARGPAGKD
jgi:hypothetical protein